MKKLLKRGLIAFVVLFIVLATASVFYVRPGRGPRETVDLNAGSLQTIDGIRVVHLKGSPYAMGYQHGALLKTEVQRAAAGFDAILDEASGEFKFTIAGRQIALPREGINIILDVLYRRCSVYFPARYARELEGLADGAGVPLQKVRRMQVLSELTERACSAFAVWGNATGNGKHYHGHNFDWAIESKIQDNAGLFIYQPDGLVPFAAPGYAGLIGHFSGMNAQKITVSMIGAINTDGRSTGIPLALLLRSLLEQSKNLDDAMRIITTAHRTVGYNYVISDGKVPTARAFETTANKCAIFTDNDPEETVEYAIRIDDAVFRADEAMDQNVRKTQKCSKGWPNMPYGSNSYDHRYKGIATRIKQNYGKIDDTVALDILKATAMVDANIHGFLANATDNVVYYAHAAGLEDASKQTYVRFDLNQLMQQAK
ncbi:MAG: C45 family autoproteolytic acyltransferase/hydrolase [Candidatus Hydrogenedentes bacterium]|nr:C45 family autoproteolytic acyltransferase/hydrolase [Candidatus Hydrogenedentota bacterium]